VKWTIQQLKDGFDDSIRDREEVHLRKMQNFEREKNKGFELSLISVTFTNDNNETVGLTSSLLCPNFFLTVFQCWMEIS